MTSRTRLTLFGLLAAMFALCRAIDGQEYTYAVAKDFRIPGLTDLQARQALRDGMALWTGEADLSFRKIAPEGEWYTHADGFPAFRFPDFTFTNYRPGYQRNLPFDDRQAWAYSYPPTKEIRFNLDPATPIVPSLAAPLAGHESGHVIMGTGGHSRNPRDLMANGGFMNLVPSARERAWLVAKYGRKVR